MTRNIVKKSAVALAAVAVMFSLTGCAEASDTTCKEFAKMSDSKKEKTLKKWAKEEGDNSKPSDAEVTAAVTGVDLMCSMDGNENKTLGELLDF